MANFTIDGTDAGTQETPPLEGEQFNTDWIRETFPASQQRVNDDTDFKIQFVRPIDTTLVDNDNFTLYLMTAQDPLVLEEVVSPFITIDWVADYDSVSRILILHLEDDMDNNSTYYFSIDTLYDTLANVMLDPHVIAFLTSAAGSDLEIDTALDVDTVIIEDYSLVDPGAIEMSATLLYTSSIPDGTINVASTVDSIDVTFNTLIDDTIVQLREEDMETGEVVVLDITADQDSGTLILSIDLTDQGDGVYVRPNCIYTLDMGVATIEFTGVLSPFYVSLSAFRPYTSDAAVDPIGWARLVWTFSKEIQDLLPTGYDEVTNATLLANYTKYYVLAIVSDMGSSESFMLGELQITASVQSGINYRELMAPWESRIYGWTGQVRTTDIFWPRTGRLWHDQRSSIHREWKTFDRRLD